MEFQFVFFIIKPHVANSGLTASSTDFGKKSIVSVGDPEVMRSVDDRTKMLQSECESEQTHSQTMTGMLLNVGCMCVLRPHSCPPPWTQVYCGERTTVGSGPVGELATRRRTRKGRNETATTVAQVTVSRVIRNGCRKGICTTTQQFKVDQ